jgi:hypothetical protein
MLLPLTRTHATAAEGIATLQRTFFGAGAHLQLATSTARLRPSLDAGVTLSLLRTEGSATGTYRGGVAYAVAVGPHARFGLSYPVSIARVGAWVESAALFPSIDVAFGPRTVGTVSPLVFAAALGVSFGDVSHSEALP